MKITFGQLINDIRDCNCARCALLKKAKDSDSKAEAKRLQDLSNILDCVMENCRGLANSMSSGGNEELDKLATELTNMGYPAYGDLVRGYVSIVEKVQGLYDNSFKETSDKEAVAEAADRQSAKEAAMSAGAE